jgi:hypothetical protein
LRPLKRALAKLDPPKHKAPPPIAVASEAAIRRRRKTPIAKTFLLAAALSAVTSIAHADAFTPALLANAQAEGQSQLMTGIRGSCYVTSHIAVGPVGTDVSRQQTPFACDTAVIVVFDQQNRHVEFNFAKKAATKKIIAFAGTMIPYSNNMFLIQTVYFEPGKATKIDEGVCRVFFAGRHISAIDCGTKIDADGQRTVASIIFDAEPGQ